VSMVSQRDARERSAEEGVEYVSMVGRRGGLRSAEAAVYVNISQS
jgi:precorrin isomerase